MVEQPSLCRTWVKNLKDRFSCDTSHIETAKIIFSDFFSFLGTVPILVQLGKISSFSLQLGKTKPLDLYENTGWKCQAPTPRTIKITVSNLYGNKLLFLMQVLLLLSNFEDWENIIHFGNFFASIGKKAYFLALGTIPVTGVGFIARKITASENMLDHAFFHSSVKSLFKG